MCEECEYQLCQSCFEAKSHDIGFSLSLRGSSGPRVSIMRASIRALDVDSGAIIKSDQFAEDEFRHITVKPGPGQLWCNMTLLNEVDGRKRLNDKNAVKNIRIECAV